MKAHDFNLPDQNGKMHSLSDYTGKWLVLYFYPKDDTPGCTIEACSFRDSRKDFHDIGAEIVGISKDGVTSHKKFEERHNLNFTLLSDESHSVIEAYDSWNPKKMFGKEFLGVERNTFLISPEGELVKTYKNVNPVTHSSEIIAEIKNLQNNTSSI